MSERYPGGIISKTGVTPSGPYETSTASGIWTLDQQAYWNKLGQWPTAGNKLDAQFNYVAMLLHGDGTNGAQNNTFLDSSTNNFTITRNGNTTQGSFSPYGSNWSNYFNGSSYLDVASATASGSGSFCLEAWIYCTNVSLQQQIIANATSGGMFLGINVNSANKLGIGRTFVAIDNEVSFTWVNNTWYHIAVNRNGSSLQFFVNGTQVGATGSNSINYSTSGRQIGSESNGTSPFYGYISNLRCVNASVYTTTFTPSTTPLTAITSTTLLTCQSNRFIDNSTNNYTITVGGTTSVQRFNPFGASTAYSTSVIGGSGYFDGTTDYLTTPMSTPLTLGAGDFTIECWLYSAFSGEQRPLSCLESTLNYYIYAIYLSGTELRFYAGNGTSYAIQMTASGVMKPNAWNHVAVVRSGSTATMYLNGVSVATDTSATVTLPAAGTPLWFGGEAYGGGYNFFNGYMTDARIVKGTAVYTAAFTPPTAPLTAITNTSILLNYTNGAIFDNAMINNLETVGNAQISTSVKKFGTGSMSFVRSPSSYLVANNKSGIFSFGTGDFTVEAWVYLNTMPTAVGYPENYWIVGGGPTNNNLGFDISIGSTDLVVNLVSFASPNILVTHGMTTATWYHIAVTRSGSTLYAFKDGAVLATASVTGVTANPCLTGLAISAAEPVGATEGNFNGYIDDLRITKGYARYTATFTPPTAAFPNVGPT